MHVSASVIVFSYRSELGQGQEKEEHSGSALQQHSLRESSHFLFCDRNVKINEREHDAPRRGDGRSCER